MEALQPHLHLNFDLYVTFMLELVKMFAKWFTIAVYLHINITSKCFFFIFVSYYKGYLCR